MKRCMLVFLFLFAVSCSEDPGRPRPEREAEATRATSWQQVPVLLEKALEEKNIALYDSLLARNFIFHFTPQDVAKKLTPSSWAKEREMRAITGLFSDPNVETLSVQWVVGELDESPIIGSDGRLLLSDVEMVIPKHLPNGELLPLKATGTFILDLVEMPWTDEDGHDIWKVMVWWDKTSQGSAE